MADLIIAASIEVQLAVDESGDAQVTVSVDPDDAPLVQVLGLLRFAEDTVIRDRMGEA